MDKRKIMENLLALANDKCNKFASAAAYAKYLKMKAELDGKQTSESTKDQTENVMVDDEEWNVWKHLSSEEYDKYFNTIYAVEGGYLIRRSTFLNKMWLHFASQINAFGNEYPGVYKNCMKQLRFYVQLQINEFECKARNYKSEGGFTIPDAINGNPELIGNPKTNYLMFLTADEYSVIKGNHDNVVNGIRSDVEEKDKNRKK